ncbi:MAG: zinc-dependent metalloprotease family protein [bacterium]
MKFFTKLLTILSALLLFSPLVNDNYAQSNDGVWKFISETQVELVGEKLIVPAKYQVAELNINKFLEISRKSPMEFTREAKESKLTLSIPQPDGTFISFYIYESPVMAPELAAKYPAIKTYSGRGIEDKLAYARFDFTPHGFHAWIRTSKGTVYVDPHNQNNIIHYLSYYKRDAVMSEKNAMGFEACGVESEPENLENIQNLNKSSNYSQNRLFSGENLRTYRLANATTGEYTQFHGGTVELGLSAVVTAINRVTGVYETELAIRMTLVANNNLLIYTDPATDPYTNTNPSSLLNENQTNITSVIGSANYDIGHVFSTGGGGLAQLLCVCKSTSKARGETGLPQPTGDPFYIDYVAHEMGHQFGANHPFNGNAGSCAGGNRNPTTAYEPGSGSTIMAYAGICGSQNLQMNSDDYFHVVSLQEIITYTTTGSGNGCPVTTATGNSAPTANAGTDGYVLPISTPFQLTGSGTDPNADPLTYCWEEWDLGPAGSPTAPSGDAAIFRSYDPTTSPTRIFPKLSNLLNNTYNGMGEFLPTYARNLKFRLTVRDNQSAGGVHWDQVNFTVTDAAGPFQVTSPNTAISWTGNTSQTITWNVANTSGAAVNCQHVNILLSTDGGNNFNTTILTNTANDGSETVTLPNLPTSQARIKVEAADNIFFDISNTNFTITDGTPVELTNFRIDVQKSGAQLIWETASELNNSGFNIERSSDSKNFSQITFIKGKGTTTEKSIYRYIDNSVKTGKFYYRLKQVDFDGSYEYSQTIEADLGIPQNYVLEQNHPNPFNPTTVVKFSLPVDSKVSLKLYNVVGQEVKTLLEGTRSSGTHEITLNASYLPSGIYFYTINAIGNNGSNFTATKKMILMK